jgi:hypothetical protein
VGHIAGLEVWRRDFFLLLGFEPPDRPAGSQDPALNTTSLLHSYVMNTGNCTMITENKSFLIILDCKILGPHNGIKIVVFWGVMPCSFLQIFL